MSLAFTILVAGLSQQVDGPLALILESQGYAVRSASGLQALLAILSRSIDLVLLDISSAEDLANLGMLRAACPCAMIVLGPARDDRLMVAALEQGADDYVQRPYRTDELLARIRAQLRRHERNPGFALTFGPLSIDPYDRQAMCNGELLDLSPEEYALLAILASRPGFACPASLLLEQVWGSGRRDDLDVLTAAVARLRSLIETNPDAPLVLSGSAGLGYWLGGASRERELNAE